MALKNPVEKKSLKLKVSGNKVLPFWDFIFKDFFSGSSIILYKKVPGKKSFYSRKCMETKDVYSHRKRVPGFQNSGLYFQWHFVLGLPEFVQNFFPGLSFIDSFPSPTPPILFTSPYFFLILHPCSNNDDSQPFSILYQCDQNNEFS